ncbi:MAG: hypothetical protein FD180_1019 [Planctomycetota bacterium]|nr:MAG: hypothetical protein FD180_1019 [Planctomycetota bacterium]
METTPTAQPAQPPSAGASTALKVGAFGCGGCGCVLVLGGLFAIIAAAAGAVNSSEVGTAVGIGIGCLVPGVLGLGVGVLCFVMSRKKPPA